MTNSSTSFTDSVVMFERAAHRRRTGSPSSLGISQVRLMTPEIESVSAGAPVSVVVGEDNASSAG